jgi:Holliday junction resolvase RusA-like endonuclease
MTRYVATILGEAASKANSRKFAWINGRMVSIKSDKALGFVRSASTQLRRMSPLLEGPVRVTMTMYYASQRPDLDESLVLDVLQGRAYSNDRQVREKHVYHRIDRARPRVEVMVEPMES